MKSRRYSIVDLAESLKPGADQRKAQFEQSISQMMLEPLGPVHDRVGAAIPGPRLARDLELGTATAGGNLVGTNVLNVARAARPKLVLEEAGCRVTTVNATGQVQLPTFRGDVATSVWIQEGAASPTFSALEVKSVTLHGKQAASRIAYTRRTALGAPDRQAFESRLQQELQSAVRSQLESAVLSGSGSSGQPLGLTNTPGHQAVALSSTPTFADMLSMVEQYADSHGDMATARFILHPSDAVKLMQSLVSANGGETVLSYQNGEYRIAGIPCLISGNIAEGKLLLFDPPRTEIVYFGPATMLIDPFSNGKSITGQTEIHLINFIDLGVSDPSLVVVGST